MGVDAGDTWRDKVRVDLAGFVRAGMDSVMLEEQRKLQQLGTPVEDASEGLPVGGQGSGASVYAVFTEGHNYDDLTYLVAICATYEIGMEVAWDHLLADCHPGSVHIYVQQDQVDDVTTLTIHGNGEMASGCLITYHEARVEKRKLEATYP